MVELPKINVIYEDNHIIVVEKNPGMSVQKDISGELDLLTLIKNYLKVKYNKPGEVYLGLVHRLDKPVGGIMIFAKTSKAASRLSEAFRNNEVHKEYYAVVDGILKGSGTLVNYLEKDTKNNIVKITDEKHGKKAILNYKTVMNKDKYSLVNIDLITGRSHQIRVQLAHFGYPIYNDHKYANESTKGDIALFAYSITIMHPTLKDEMTFKVNLPDRYPFTLFKGI